MNLIYLAQFGVVMLMLLPPMVVHELGHWLAAKLCGAWTPIFSIGEAENKGQFVLGYFLGTQFRGALFPTGAYVRVISGPIPPENIKALEKATGLTAPPLKQMSRRQLVCIYAAGPAVNAAIAATCGISFYLLQGGSVALSAALLLLSLSNSFLLLFSLTPIFGSDGRELLDLLFDKNRQI